MDPIVKDYERALQLEKEGKHAESIKIVQSILSRDTQHAVAVDAALIWARLETSNPDSLFWLGNAYMYQGRFPEAAAAFDFCTRMNPQHAEAFSALGLCIRNMGDLPKALNASQQALAIKDDDMRSHLNYMDVLYDMGYFEDGLNYGLTIAKHYPDDIKVDTNLARFYSALEDNDKSLLHHKKTIKKEPYNPIFRINYLSALFRAKDFEEIPKQLRIANDLFEKKELYKRIVPLEYEKVRYQTALAEDRVLDQEHDRLLMMRDMDKIEGDEYEALKLLDKSNPVWLFKGQDIRCFTTDWAFYDKKDIFLNSKVTGKWFTFLLTFGIGSKAYVTEKYPHITIEEPCLVFGGSDNYYHWINDFLPRLSILEFHPELKDLPIYINGTLTSFQKQSLAHIGITEDRLRLLPNDHVAIFKNAHIAYIPGRPITESGEPDWMKPNENPFILQWLRKTYLKDITLQRKKRYFLSRKNAEFRRVLNEDEIFELTREYGFEKLENQGKSFMDQVALYAQADAVIGPHGAGFTNMAFAPADATLIEFLPRARKLPFYSSMCREIGQTYIPVEGPILKIFPDRSSDFGDFYLEPENFKKLLKETF